MHNKVSENFGENRRFRNHRWFSFRSELKQRKSSMIPVFDEIWESLEFRIFGEINEITSNQRVDLTQEGAQSVVSDVYSLRRSHVTLGTCS